MKLRQGRSVVRYHIELPHSIFTDDQEKMMDVTLGLGGASRHACAALCAGQQLVAACEQERITRVRAAGVNASGLPDEVVDFLLERRGLKRSQITRVAVGEGAELTPSPEKLIRFEHHRGHAATSYLTSPFESATIVVCDHQAPEISVWLARGPCLSRVEWPWRGPGFAWLYSTCAEVLGFKAARRLHLEALARLQPDVLDERLSGLFRYAGDSLELSPNWQARIADLHETASRAVDRQDDAAALGAAVQNAIGELLCNFLADVQRKTSATNLCLAGSLFYNTALCTLAKTSGLFEHVFVPVNPGNAGLAVGNALHAVEAAPRLASAFLGPSFDSEEVKSTLDNCKLTYDWAGELGAITRAVDALQRGSLVGWFTGSMEWGPRALGARSIVASPFSPYVLENLNRFLKRRQPWRGYALSALEQDMSQLFDGPAAAPFMECDYQPKDRERFRHVLPHPRAAIRAQTVGVAAPRQFRDLLHAFGQATGSSVLVNTSFNGFSEPIVCSPRDAIRVFYGTGLDMLVLDSFVVVK
jgi:carbamoyltransferase